jgi:hypothetical protein
MSRAAAYLTDRYGESNERALKLVNRQLEKRQRM